MGNLMDFEGTKKETEKQVSPSPDKMAEVKVPVPIPPVLEPMEMIASEDSGKTGGIPEDDGRTLKEEVEAEITAGEVS